jgi:hypothetical protein
MKYEDFFQLVTTRDRGFTQHQRLKAIWASAHYSIGCSTGIAAEFEAEVLVDALKRARETIGSINEKVREICILFPEYKYLLSERFVFFFLNISTCFPYRVLVLIFLPRCLQA